VNVNVTEKPEDNRGMKLCKESFKLLKEPSIPYYSAPLLKKGFTALAKQWFSILYDT